MERNLDPVERLAAELRSPFGAIEDWNYITVLGDGIYEVAVALRGDRGLEQLVEQVRSQALGLRSPFGAIEDWNGGFFAVKPLPALVAVALRGDRGLEQDMNWKLEAIADVAVALRGDRGLEPVVIKVCDCCNLVAVALRGDRGLERIDADLNDRLIRLRSPFGAIEDWNMNQPTTGLLER